MSPIQIELPPEPKPLSLTEQQAKLLEELPARLFAVMLNDWAFGIRTLWENPDTATVLNHLGTKAATVFAHSADLAVFLESKKPGCTAPFVALIRPFTINKDGTVTLVAQEKQAE